MRILLADELPRLTGECRIDFFGTITIAKGKRIKTLPAAWQGWNPDPVLEGRMARLKGSGSFYWAGAVKAFAAVRKAMATDASITQAKIETISGREVGRVYR